MEKGKKYDVELELYRNQMKVRTLRKEELMKDFEAKTNFRAAIRIIVDEEEAVVVQSGNQWVLTNGYASKGTVSGKICATGLKTINVAENKVMKNRAKKQSTGTLVSMMEYLAHDRHLHKDMTSVSTEGQLAWGLKDIEKKSIPGIPRSGKYLEKHQRYTWALGHAKKDPTEFKFVMALKTRYAGAEDIYAKHATLTDKDKYDVEAAGECTVHYKEEGRVFVICLDPDSGTFRPSVPHVMRAKDLLENVFAEDVYMKHYDWKIVVASRPMLLPKKPKEGNMSKEDMELLLKNYELYMSNSFPQAAEQREDVVAIYNANSIDDLGLAYI